MIRENFKKWLHTKGIDFSDYDLLNDNAQQEINAEYMKENVETNKRYKIKDLEKQYPNVCIEITSIKKVKDKIVSGILVNIFSNTLQTEERYWELIQKGLTDNYIVGI